MYANTNADVDRSIGYLFHTFLGYFKFAWYLAPFFFCVGVINGWWPPGWILLLAVSIDFAVDILGIILTVFVFGPAQSQMNSNELAGVSRWSRLKQSLSDQWHFSASLTVNALFMVALFSFYFQYMAVLTNYTERYIVYHALYVVVIFVKIPLLFFTGYTSIRCDECGPSTVKPCVECEPDHHHAQVSVSVEGQGDAPAPGWTQQANFAASAVPAASAPRVSFHGRRTNNH